MCGVADAFGIINKSRHKNELLFHKNKKFMSDVFFMHASLHARWFLNNCMLWLKCLLDELFSASNMKLITEANF